jgi:predicted nucleic acid-binding protein
MTTGDVNSIFLDTNILVYATIDASPFYARARAALAAYETNQAPLWISRQVLREYLATVVRPNVGIPLTEVTTAVRQFELRFQVAEEGPAVTAQLLALIEQGYSRQVHDTNIVATMQMIGVSHILTHNTNDFSPFSSFITVIPLLSLASPAPEEAS